MSARYGQVYSSQLARWAGWSGDEIAVAVHLRASKHASTEGLAEIPAAYIAHDRRWDVEHVDRILDRLVELGDIVRDGDWVLVIDALEHHSITTQKHAQGAVKRLSEVPMGSAVYARFIQLVGEHCPLLLDELRAASRIPSECHSDGSHEVSVTTSPSPSPSPNTNTSTSQPASSASAHEGGPAGVADASSIWEETVRPCLENDRAWAEDIRSTGTPAFVTWIGKDLDADWSAIAADAWTQRQIAEGNPRRLTTPSALKALELKHKDWRNEHPRPSPEEVQRRRESAAAFKANQDRQIEYLASPKVQADLAESDEMLARAGL